MYIAKRIFISIEQREQNREYKQMSFLTPSQSTPKLPLPTNYNSPISLQLNPDELKNLPQHQRIEYFTKIKKQANYFLLTAYRALEDKNYSLAKVILVYIADSCSCIQSGDKQAQQLIELCYEQLAQLKRVEDWALERQRQQQQRKNNNNLDEKAGNKRLELLVMKYNKFSSEFQCDEQQRKIINPEVLFYLSKINAILVGEQTTENIHSMLAMLKLYSVEILFLSIIVSLIIVTEITNIKTSMFGLPDNTVNFLAIGISVTFILPLIVIFLKNPVIKDSQFFQNRLTLEIKKINQECRQKGNKIVFMIPQGMELNVKVQYDVDEFKEDDIKPTSSREKENSQKEGIQLDLSRIRKRVTNNNEKNSKDEQIKLIIK